MADAQEGVQRLPPSREVELNPPDTCRSPYLKLPHGGGRAVITHPGHDPLVLQF